MRVRRFELRLLAGVLAVAWALFAGLVLVLYRPGGPADLAVVVIAAVPTAIAIAALMWPPVARSTRAFAAIVWLGLGVVLVLVPSLGDLLGQLRAGGTQTLLPSVEAAYPWLLALAGTSLFAGLGVARARLGETALRGPRLALGVLIALALTAATGTLFAAAAIGNDVAIRDRPASASRFGPTGGGVAPVACTADLAVPASANVDLTLSGTVDGRSLGTVETTAVRAGADAREETTAATVLELDRTGAALVGGRAYALTGDSWLRSIPTAVETDLGLDVAVLRTALAARNRTTAESHGEEYVEGARARHCRSAVDGPTFLLAFPGTRRIVAGADLHRWRGELDYWVFGDGAVGLVSGSVNGDAGTLPAPGILGTITMRMEVTDRGGPLAVTEPTPR